MPVFALVCALIGVGAPVMALTAQPTARRPPRLQPEARADFVNARARAAHLGVGLSGVVGTYVRLGAVAGAGQAWRDGEAAVGGRVEALARFVVDPLRESRWAPYATGGVGALYDEQERWRGVIVGALGLEGPPMGVMIPSIEIGFGGGARVGVVLRRALSGRR